MGLLHANNLCKLACTSFSSKTHMRNTSLSGTGNSFCLTGSRQFRSLQPEPGGFGTRIVAFASRKTVKKLKRIKEQQDEVLLQTSSSSLDNPSSKSSVENEDLSFVNDNIEANAVPSRSNVLQACTVTSAVIAALGLVIRQVSDIASSAGLPVSNCSQVSFGFEVWHLELIAGLVVSISLSRYTLLKTWPDFRESSEAANKQVLSSLESFDYLIVAFLPGISEELLFRGGLMPLFGLNWISVSAVAALFGVLHLGSGRKFSFAIWATLVGLLYGYATVVSSSLAVPMASHALNNLVGAILWRQTSWSSEQNSS